MKKLSLQVFGFLISTVGWLLVCCTMGMDYWRVSYIGGQGGSWIILAAWYWSTLWKDCYVDSSDVSNCRDYDTEWIVRPGNRAEQGPIQAVRALLIVGMALGFFASIFSFIGMDCTYIGGGEKPKNKVLLLGTVLHFAGGISCFAAYCFFTGRLGTVVFTRLNDARILRYYIGPPIFLGLIGSPSIILGAVLYAVTLYNDLKSTRKPGISSARKYMAPKAFKAQRNGETLYIRDDASTQSSSSTRSIDQVQKRDSFV